tara:strand:+ start:1265 stop:2272 length:1008 start_codon:yes stop_codon:yes gene_type:complete
MKGIFNNERGFGVEIEFARPRNISQQDIVTAINLYTGSVVHCEREGYNHITRPHWKLVGDSSVDGHRGYIGSNELVSPILYGQDGKEQLRIVLQVLNDLECEVNVSCGIHTHHDVTDVMVKEEKDAAKFLTNLIKFVAKFEHFIYRLVSPSRLKRNWCLPVRKIFASMTADHNTMRSHVGLRRIAKRIFGRVKDGVKYKYNAVGAGVGTRYTPDFQASRYCGLNLKNIWTRGSVEFRYMQGSLNFEKIWTWVVFTQAIINVVENANSVAFKNVPVSSAGFFYFRKALGFIGSKDRCSDVRVANKVIQKRYSDLTLPHLEGERQSSSYYHLTKAGI